MKFKKFIFYFLSFTWGILLTLVGLVVAGVLLLAGKKPKKDCWCWIFEVGEDWGGLNLGIVILTDKDPSVYTKVHEVGHAIQNCMWGLLMIFVITIPSAIRYWYRELKYHRKGKCPPTDYEDIWFEDQDTSLGLALMYELL